VTTARRGVAVLLLLTAAVAQPVLIGVLPLPLGGPSLPLLVLAVVALVGGPTAGVGAGFGLGLVSDLASTHPLGQTALALTVVGYLAGLAHGTLERSLVVPLAVVAGVSAAGPLLVAAVAQITGGGEATARSLARGVTGPVVYDVLLAPLLVPLLARLLVDVDAGDPPPRA